MAGSVLLLWVSGPEYGRLAKPRRSDQQSSLFYFIYLNLRTVNTYELLTRTNIGRIFKCGLKRPHKILKKFTSLVDIAMCWLSISKLLPSFPDFLIPSKSLTFAPVNTPFYPLSWQPSVLTPEGYCWVDGLFSILNSIYFVIQTSQSHWAFVKGFG